MTTTKATARYRVLHSMGEFFWKALHFPHYASANDIAEAMRGGHYKLVHTVLLPEDDMDEQLERIFFETQNLDEAWNPKHPCRSTSVGDVVEVEDKFFIVAPEGFEQMPSEVLEGFCIPPPGRLS